STLGNGLALAGTKVGGATDNPVGTGLGGVVAQLGNTVTSAGGLVHDNNAGSSSSGTGGSNPLAPITGLLGTLTGGLGGGSSSGSGGTSGTSS
ncbi:hypothetical protein FH721_25100, partial [Bacteroides thetaiotaomicron]|nr:hypothetical protein [Bacteroides thetaiotaomicron]